VSVVNGSLLETVFGFLELGVESSHVFPDAFWWFLVNHGSLEQLSDSRHFGFFHSAPRDFARAESDYAVGDYVGLLKLLRNGSARLVRAVIEDYLMRARKSQVRAVDRKTVIV
jgi:hypothetical protein